MDITPLGVLLFLAFGALSFVVTRWLSRRSRQRRAQRERDAQQVGQSRQVRRAQQRRERRR